MVLEAAQACASFGWHIFPCHSAIDGQCSCGRANCKNIGKHPRTQKGLRDATGDCTQIQSWWRTNGRAPSNVAIATGEISRLVVIDIDPRHGGDETLAMLEVDLGPLPRDWTVRTGGGGIHIYLTYPDDGRIRSRNGWRPGVDIKADGGYVVAPPSIHEHGARYEWQSQVGSAPPLVPPQWLAALGGTSERSPVRRNVTVDDRSVLLQRAQQYAASIPGSSEGGRNDAAFRLAGHIASLVTETGDRLSEEEILSVVQSWNTRCSPPLDDRELETCVTSALKNGTPRTDKEVKIFTPDEVGEGEEDDSTTPEKPRKSQATLLVELVDNAYLFHDPDGEAHARFPVGGDALHWEVARVRTRQFKRWLAERFFREHGKVPAAQAQQDALGVIEAKAVFDGAKHNVCLRLGQHEGRIYFDLCNDQWQVVEIDRGGWRILEDSPVMFRRSRAMLPAPTPAQGGSVQELRHFANVTDEDWPLVLAWLVATMRPTGPYPVLAVHGEHGSGKSGLCRRLRSIVDPNTAPLRADHREPRDLMICANGGWVMALDNLSHIPAWLSDCFCRLATGGGFSCRTLFQDDEETIFNAQRPLVLNCIEEVVTRSDLLDRCVLVNLPRIEQSGRRPEKQLDREFEAARPRILGGLLTAAAMALRTEDEVKLPRLPRMADFAIWATAAEPGLGLAPGKFLAAYESNRAAGNETAIEASLVGKSIVEFVAAVNNWTGTATQLLEELESRGDEKTKRLKTWPNGSRALGGAVKRLAPNLRDAGIGVEFGRNGRSRKITLSRTDAGSIVMNVTYVTAPEKQAFPGDDVMTQSKCGDAGDGKNVTAQMPLISDESDLCDVGDDTDAEIPAQSIEPVWTEV